MELLKKYISLGYKNFDAIMYLDTHFIYKGITPTNEVLTYNLELIPLIELNENKFRFISKHKHLIDNISVQFDSKRYYEGGVSYEDCFVGKKIAIKELFKNYYFGCGGVSSFYLQEIEEENFGKPLVRWDLD